MIIIRLSGGLGNQMFQYAFGRSISERLNTDLFFDLSDNSLNIHNGYMLSTVFDIDPKIATVSEIHKCIGILRYSFLQKILKKVNLKLMFKFGFIIEDSFEYDRKYLHVTGNSYFSGYWQSEKYFLPIKEKIKNEFTFPKFRSTYNINLAKMIKNQNSISIHIRRGDYIKVRSINLIHGTCSMKFYYDAISYVSKRVSNPIFFVFSDDIEWVKSNLNINYETIYVDLNIDKNCYLDMQLMTMCKHNIISNSTFSWWAAWLNKNDNKTVVAPKKWFNNHSVISVFPEDWIIL